MEIPKFTFAIIPFKYSYSFDSIEKIAAEGGIWQEECSDYSRFYKHININLDKRNPNRSIIEYKAVLSPEKSSELGFYISDKHKYLLTGRNEAGEYYRGTVWIPEIKMFVFDTNIGFISCNFIFEDNIDFESMCELICLIKKMKFHQDNEKNKTLTMRLEDQSKCINLLEIIQNTLLGERFSVGADLFFDRSDVKRRVSAMMLSSFLFEKEISEKEAVMYLRPLKRSQSKTHEVGFYREVDKERVLRPFKNMFWGFSPQGVANINYVVEKISNEKFIRSLYTTIKREYLFMTVFLLNQSYTLIDYCHAFSTAADKAVSQEEIQRMHNFRLKHVFNTVSILEHYREYYEKLRNALAIDSLLHEVDEKLDSLYKKKEDQRDEYLRKIENRVVTLTLVFTILLAILGIVSTMNAGYYLYVDVGLKNFLLLFVGTTIALAVIVFIIVMTVRKLRKTPDL